MALNFDGQWEVRIFYASGTLETNLMNHVLKFDVNVEGEPVAGTSMNDIGLTLPDATGIELDVYLNTVFMPLLLPCYPGEANFISAELWKIPEGTYNGTFISVMELGDIGTNAADTPLANQTTFTFRSLGGGGGRIQLMESSFSGNTRQSPPYASAQANALTAHVISTSCPILARDNTRFIARIAQSDGQNEILWRKRFRNI